MKKTLAALAMLAVLVAGCPEKKSKVGCPSPIGTEWDLDGDLLTDVKEAALGTDPASADSDGDGFGDYVEVSAGTDPNANSSAPSGALASVKQIENVSELIGGPRAQGRVGDWLLENDRIRAIVQDPAIPAQMQITSYGGNLIDADVKRAVGEPGRDLVGMLVPFINVGATLRAERMVVVNDGADGGAAILRACGTSDVVEYLDAKTVLSVVGGLTIDWDGNVPLPLEVATDYVLAPGSDTVEVVTTIANKGSSTGFLVGDIMDSGGAEEIFVSNIQGFGELGFAALANVMPPSRFLGYTGEGAAWGVIPDSDPNVVVTVSGYSFLVAEFNTFFEFAGSGPDSDLPGVNVVGKGKKYSWHRGLKVTDGTGLVEPFNAEYLERRALGNVATGTVRDSNGAPLAGARVVAMLSSTDTVFDRLPIVATESAADGSYSFTLEDGSYYILADVDGRGQPTFTGGTPGPVVTRSEQNTFNASLVTVSAAATTLPDITFPPKGTLTVTAREIGTNAPIPTRLIVTGVDPSPADNVFRDARERLGQNGVIAEQLSKTGDFAVDLPPGTYGVYVTKGLEWSLGRQVGVVLGTAGTAVNLTLGRAVETPGYINADFHVHNGNSVDAISSPLQQALNASAAGIDVLIATDHDYLTNYAPLISSLGLSTSMASLVGNEITSLSYGHFIAFPLEHDPNDPVGGAVKWTGPLGEAKTPAEIFAAVDADNAGTQIEQMCHPRGFKLQSYYTAIELDTATLASKAPPERFRFAPQAGATADDTKLFYAGFDAMEMMNGPDDYGTPKLNRNLNDFFTFLSHGLQITPTGNSDSHYIFGRQIGWPRNYVKIANDAPSGFGAPQVEEFTQAIIDGKLYFTSGPQILMTVTGNTTGEPGDVVTASGTVNVNVSLQMPDWVEVDTLNVYMNTPNTTALPTEDGNATAPVAVTSVPIALTTTANGLGIQRKVATVTVPNVTLPTGKDAWIVVTVESLGVSAPTLFPVISAGPAAGVRPFAMAGPVYVDATGDGIWTPPGIQTAVAKSAHGEPPVEEFDAHDIRTRELDVREQWERLTAGEHKH